MGVLDIYTLYVIFEGIFLLIGISSIKYSNKNLYPNKNSMYYKKRSTYHRVIYFKEIEPIIIEILKKYHLYLVSEGNRFKKFNDLFELISNKIDSEIEHDFNNIKRLINESKIYENIPLLVGSSKTMKKLISGCKSFYIYINTFKKLKISGIICFILMGVDLILLLVFNNFKDLELVYTISLIINIFFIGGISTLFLFILIGYYKIYNINKKFYEEIWIPPRNVDG